MRKKELGGKRGRTGREIRAGAKKKRETGLFFLCCCYFAIHRLDELRENEEENESLVLLEVLGDGVEHHCLWLWREEDGAGYGERTGRVLERSR